jgi:hypothetical protein
MALDTLCLSSLTNVFCGNYATARAKGVLSALMGNAADAVNMIDDGLAMWRSTEGTARVPFYMS